ncbi:hypothetical protein D3C71_1329910 [compost metagenome]
MGLTGAVHIHRRAVDKKRAFRHKGCEIGPDGDDMLALGQHGDDAFGVPYRLIERCGRIDAGFGGSFH